MTRIRPLLLLLGALAASGAGPRPAPLEALFRDPPVNDRRILQIVHAGNPKKPAEMKTRLEDLYRRGFGGVVTNVSFENYLRSEQAWTDFRVWVEAGKKLGMTLWLYDEKGYPSASAGGLTLEGHPEWEASGLHAIAAEVKPGEPLRLPDGDVVYAAMFPAGADKFQDGIDVSGDIGTDRILHWGKPGAWRIFAFVRTRLYEGTHATSNYSDTRPYPNLLLREPTDRFINLTHAEYARRVTPLRGTFDAIFTDERP